MPDHMLDPEKYEGHIIVDGAQIPFAATISADLTGRLRPGVEPLQFEGRSSDLVRLMRSIGSPGTAVSEFRVACSSASGKRIESDRAYLTTYRHTCGTLEIGLAFAEAFLRMPVESSSANPSLCFWLRGFRSFGPALRAHTPLGEVFATGSTERPGDFDITGRIVVSAPEAAVAERWKSEAEQLLKHIRLALSFANGGILTTPVVEYRHGGLLEVAFYSAGASAAGELPVQHFLNLAPFFAAAAASFEAARPYQDALATAIGWLLVETTHDEVRFLGGMTALESLAAHQLTEEVKQLMPAETFQQVKADIEAVIDRRQDLGVAVRDSIKSKLRGLNRQSLAHNVSALFDLWNVNTNGISGRMLRQLVDTRNSIVHSGMTANEDALWELIIVVREIIVRFVLAMLQFNGNYECYLGGHHMRHFPSCERIAGSS